MTSAPTDERSDLAGAELSAPGEFETIARLFRPLTDGSPEALGLTDDVAVMAPRPGHDLVVTADAMVEGVHFLASEPLDLVARKLLRANLSDLAAKGAEPHGYLLTIAWPRGTPFEAKARFAAGLAEDQARYGVRLLGGDTVSTPGPLTASLTMLGWTPAGALVRRGGARAGDVLLVSGTIGDAGLGLRVLTGELDGLDEASRQAVMMRHRLPSPQLELREALRNCATAAADVSDGLLADVAHIAEASGLGVHVALDRLPLSSSAATWLAAQPDRASGLLALATAGDDYEVVCTASPERVADLVGGARAAGVALTVLGEMTAEPDMQVTLNSRRLTPDRLGWTHS